MFGCEFIIRLLTNVRHRLYMWLPVIWIQLPRCEVVSLVLSCHSFADTLFRLWSPAEWVALYFPAICLY